MTVGDEASQHIDHEISQTAMAGVFNLGDVLQVIDDGLQDAAFAQQQLVG